MSVTFRKQQFTNLHWNPPATLAYDAHISQEYSARLQNWEADWIIAILRADPDGVEHLPAKS